MLCLAALVAVQTLTLSSYGYSVDEYPSQLYGDIVVAAYSNLGSPGGVRSVLETAVHESRRVHDPLPYRGATFHALVEAANSVSPLGELTTRRLMTLAHGFLGVLACLLLARAVGGAWAGLWAALLLAFVPSWYGHSFMNPSDIPFAAGHAWTLYCIARIYKELPRARLRWWIGGGIALGYTLGTRIGALFLVGYLGLALLAFVASSRAAWLADPGKARSELGRILAGALVGAILTAALTLAFWPGALLHPIEFPLAAIRATQEHPLNRQVLFDGRLVHCSRLPRSYLPHQLAINLPLVVLVCAGAAAGSAVWRAATTRGFDGTSRPRSAEWLIWLSVAFPLGFSIAARPTDYDGIRHYLFLLPSIACVGGLAIARAQAFCTARYGSRGALALVAPLAISLLAVGSTMRSLHPYEYIFHNSLVGGVEGARGRYEDEYWGTAFKEAAEKLVARLASEGVAQRPYRIAGCGPSLKWPVWPAMQALPANFRAARDAGEADFYFTISKWPCQWRIPAGARPYVSVERRGVPLAGVADLRTEHPAAAPAR